MFKTVNPQSILLNFFPSVYLGTSPPTFPNDSNILDAAGSLCAKMHSLNILSKAQINQVQDLTLHSSNSTTKVMDGLFK